MASRLRNRFTPSLMLLGLMVAASGPALASPNAPAHGAPATATKEILSEVFQVDRQYRSMMGPEETQQITLLDGGDRELLWITGFRAEVVGPDGDSRMPADFLCHSNVDIEPALHDSLFRSHGSSSGRVFTASQGQLEISLPAGFGLPLMSDEEVSVSTQVLNLGHEEEVEVRHRATIEFLRDRDLKAPLEPLFIRSVFGLALLEGRDGHFDLAGEAEPHRHGSGCLAGEPAKNGSEYRDLEGRLFTGHWVVPPGRQTNHTRVTTLLDLPFDTTAHAIAVHLHPFAESLELRDLTAGRPVFTSRARQLPDRIGLAHVESYSSESGLPLFRDHEYELVSVYNNTTRENQDSMAVMTLYLQDREFQPPAKPSRPPAQRRPPRPRRPDSIRSVRIRRGKLAIRSADGRRFHLPDGTYESPGRESVTVEDGAIRYVALRETRVPPPPGAGFQPPPPKAAPPPPGVEFQPPPPRAAPPPPAVGAPRQLAVHRARVSEGRLSLGLAQDRWVDLPDGVYTNRRGDSFTIGSGAIQAVSIRQELRAPGPGEFQPPPPKAAPPPPGAELQPPPPPPPPPPPL